MKIDNYIKGWAKIYESKIDETDYPCTDEFPQAEKDICTDPFTREKMCETEEEVNEVSTGRPNDEDPSMSGKPNFKKYKDMITSGHYFDMGIKDVGDEMEEFINGLKDTNNWSNVLERMDEGEVITIFKTILDNVDEREFQEAYGTLLESQDTTNEELDFNKARKLGMYEYGDEKNFPEWLKGNYGKWMKQTYDVFMRLSNGDEKKAEDWFRRYDRLAGSMVGTSFGTENGYIDQEDYKKQLEDELGDDPEVKELMDKLEEKWDRQRKELSDFYSSSSSRGGWTGD